MGPRLVLLWTLPILRQCRLAQQGRFADTRSRRFLQDGYKRPPGLWQFDLLQQVDTPMLVNDGFYGHDHFELPARWIYRWRPNDYAQWTGPPRATFASEYATAAGWVRWHQRHPPAWRSLLIVNVRKVHFSPPDLFLQAVRSRRCTRCRSKCSHCRRQP